MKQGNQSSDPTAISTSSQDLQIRFVKELVVDWVCKLLKIPLLSLPVIAIFREHPFYTQINVYARQQVYVLVPHFLYTIYAFFYPLWIGVGLLFIGTAIFRLQTLANLWDEARFASPRLRGSVYKQHQLFRAYLVFGIGSLTLSGCLAIIL